MISTDVNDPVLLLVVQPDFGVQMLVSNYILVIIALFIILGFLFRAFSGKFNRRNFEISEAELGIGNQKFKFTPNTTDRQIAYKIWVELSTRKIGLPIDLENDIVVEIYSSWYQFFSITRELIKEIPIEKAKSKSTRKIIDVSIDVLNEGLRPHLTQWQGRFRHWYNQYTGSNNEEDPQLSQTKFPKYNDLKKDMLLVNKKLMAYRAALYEIAFG